MKSFLYLIISIAIAITLTSANQKSTENNRSIILQASGKNVESVSLKQSADIISSRLKLFGLNSFEVTVIADKGQVIIRVPAKTNISEIEGLLLSKGELTFYETYANNEINDLLKPDNQLFKLLNHAQEQKISDPRVGCTNTENRKKADEYLKTAIPVKNCKLFWGYISKKSGYCLFALKTDMNGKPLLSGSDIESVKIVKGKDTQDCKIQIKLKPEAITLFAEATKSNLNKAIAIVIDDQVYAWPVVKSVIEAGEIEVTGNFTEKEANFFPAVFNSSQLPLSFKLLK